MSGNICYLLSAFQSATLGVTLMKTRQIVAICSRGENVAVREFRNKAVYISVYHSRTGKQVHSVKAACEHRTMSISPLVALPGDADHVLESCDMCHVIRRYNLQSGLSSTVRTTSEDKPFLLFSGPTDTVLASMQDSTIIQLKWDKDRNQLEETQRTEVPSVSGKLLYNMQYVELYDLVVFVALSVQSLVAVRLGDGSKVWEVSLNPQGVEGEAIGSWSVTCDPEGRLFIGDRLKQNRLLVLDAESGEQLQALSLDVSPKGITWLSGSLLAVRAGGGIHVYRVAPSDQE